MDFQAIEDASIAEEYARQQARQSLVNEYTSQLKSRDAERYRHMATSAPSLSKYKTTAWTPRTWWPTTGFFGWAALVAFIITFGIPIMWILHNRHWPRRWYGHLPTFPEAYGSFTQARILNIAGAVVGIKRIVGSIIFGLGRVVSVLGMIAYGWLVSICQRTYAWTCQSIYRVIQPIRVWLVDFRHAVGRYLNRIVQSDRALALRLRWVHFQETLPGQLLKVLFWSAVATIMLAAFSYSGEKVVKQAASRLGYEVARETQMPPASVTPSDFIVEPSQHSLRLAHWSDCVRLAFAAPAKAVAMFAPASKESRKTLKATKMTSDVSVQHLTLFQKSRSSSVDGEYERAMDVSTTAAPRSRSTSILQDQNSSIHSTQQRSISVLFYPTLTYPKSRPGVPERGTRSSRPEKASHLPTAQGKCNPLQGIDTSDMSLAEMEKLTGPLRLVTVGYKARQLRREQRAYCSLCKQSHAHEVMVAEMDYRYDWQM